MNQKQIIELLSKKMKLIRIEAGYTQNKMAGILGISKKTLVQIEKGRTLASWANIVALCALFRYSEVLRSTLSDDPLEIVEMIAHGGVERRKEKTLGGKVWWEDIERSGKYRLQKNLISQHYRILDDENFRWYSSFEKIKAYRRFIELAKKAES